MQASSSIVPSSAATYTLDDLERDLLRSKTVARSVIVGLPALGILASLLAALPLFAALMTGSFLLATALVARHALVRFTSRTLRLLVAARLVLVLVVGGLLFCVSGEAWAGIVSAVLLWLVADRLLGRGALNDLGQALRGRRSVSSQGTTSHDNACSLPAPARMAGNHVAGTDHEAARLFSTADERPEPGASPRRGRARR